MEKIGIDTNFEPKIALDFESLLLRYPGLELSQLDEKRGQVVGLLEFNAEFKGQFLHDEFEIQILIENSYPLQLPIAFETGGRIKRFHKFESGKLCLGAPINQRIEFNKSRTLLHFVDSLLIPYLYSFSYYRRYEKVPYGEYAHGSLGIVESYRDLTSIRETSRILRLLAICYKRPDLSNLACPCGSLRLLRKCHLDTYKTITSVSTRQEIADDIKEVAKYHLVSGGHIGEIPKIL